MGEGITATWNSAVALSGGDDRDDALVRGRREALGEGDTVQHLPLRRQRHPQEDLYNDYDNGRRPSRSPTPTRSRTLFQQIFDGATYGSRVAAVTTPTEVFGEAVEGNSLGVTRPTAW